MLILNDQFDFFYVVFKYYPILLKHENISWIFHVVPHAVLDILQ